MLRKLLLVGVVVLVGRGSSAQLGIAIAVGVFWWAHRFIPTAAELMRNSALQNLLG